LLPNRDFISNRDGASESFKIADQKVDDMNWIMIVEDKEIQDWVNIVW